jgi:serine/threonine-protein kinase
MVLPDPSILPLQAAFRSTTYRVERALGRGAMATVYLARDIKHDRHVALKVLSPGLTAALAPARFRREIAIAATLSHPHIVPVLDSGIMPTGELWFTMPYVEGESLRHLLVRERALPIRDVVRITREIADALEYAHRHHVIHRDIKPENVLLADGAVVVADFGVAKAIVDAATEERPPVPPDAAPTPTTLTQLGATLGTPAYLSPEQAVGDPQTDARTDIYALGAVAYEMLTGVPPFAGFASDALTAAKLTAIPAPVGDACGDCPPALVAIVTQCLHPDPARRPPSAAAVARGLATVAAQIGSADDAGAGSADSAAGTTRRFWWIVIGAVVLIAAALILATLLRR